MVNEPDHPAGSTLERKLVTILSADVAEYSRLMAEDEEQTLRIFRDYSQIFNALIPAHRGRVFNTAGDAILAEFSSAVEAVRCATEIQSALRTRNEQLPVSRQVRFRIGINLGDVMTQNSDLLGDGVNVAARLQGAAAPGGICISGSVYDQIRNKLSLSFESLGERHLKNIPQPVRAFSISGTEDDGELPSTKRPRPGGALAKWAIAAISLLIILGGYGAYSISQGNKTDETRVADAPSGSEKPTASQAQPTDVPSDAAIPPASVPQASQPDRARASPGPNERDASASGTAPQESSAQSPKEAPSVAAPQQSAAAQPRARPEPAKPAISETEKAPRLASAQPSTNSGTVDIDGVYAGAVCYGQGGPKQPARCFRAQANVTQGKISGQWLNGPGGIIMLLTGAVTAAGDSILELHSQSGQRGLRANLTGTLQGGHLDATGKFLNGRTISLNWQRN